MKNSDFMEIGGLTNLDIFNRVHEGDSFTPVMPLGEATFHQFHGVLLLMLISKTIPGKK